MKGSTSRAAGPLALSLRAVSWVTLALLVSPLLLPAGAVQPPFLQPALAGLFVLEAGSMDEAKQLASTDPAVQAGRFVPEILAWPDPKSLQTLDPAPGTR